MKFYKHELKSLFTEINVLNMVTHSTVCQVFSYVCILLQEQSTEKSEVVIF